MRADFASLSQLCARALVSAASDLWFPGPPQVLSVQRAPVYGAVFDRSGRQVAGAGGDGTIRVFDLRSDRSPVEMRVPVSAILSAAFDPAGRRLVTAGEDATVRIWDLQRRTADRVLDGHQGAVFSAAFDAAGERIVSAGEDGTVRVWTQDPGRAPLVLRGHSGSVYSAGFSPGGSRVVSAGADRRRDAPRVHRVRAGRRGAGGGEAPPRGDPHARGADVRGRACRGRGMTMRWPPDHLLRRAVQISSARQRSAHPTGIQSCRPGSAPGGA
jgi:hypothetical protein